MKSAAGWQSMEMLAFFQDFEVASAVARTRSSNMRLIHAVYENGVVVDQQVLAELGVTRRKSPNNQA